MPSHRLTLCSLPQPQKKTSSLRTNCASPHFLMTSFSTTAPFVVFLKNYMAKEHGFPEKRPLPTAGCRVFYNVCVPTSLPLCLPPFHTSSKTWYELLVHERSRWNHSWWWWCTRMQGAEGWTHWIAIHFFPLHQFTVSLSGLSCCLKGGSC